MYIGLRSVNALSGLYLISTLMYQIHIGQKKQRVNALSGLYLISTYQKGVG